MAHDFLTEDARRLMQRLQERLQESLSRSPDSDNSSTVTFEPDPTELERTASADRRRLSPARDLRPLSPFLSHTHRTLSIEKIRRSSRPRIEDLSRTLPREMHPSPRTPRKAALTPTSLTGRNRPKDPGEFSPVPRPKPLPKSGLSESLRKPHLPGKKGIPGVLKGKLAPSVGIGKAGVKPGSKGPQEHRVADYLLNKQRKIEEMRKALRPSFTPDISASSKKLVKKMLFTQKKNETSHDWKGLVLSVDPTAETQDSAPDTPRLRSPAVD